MHEWWICVPSLNAWHKWRDMLETSGELCLSSALRLPFWGEINMWFPVFCECFALCLLFNSCLHTQGFITYGCLMKTFLSCFWPQAFTACFNPPFKQLLHMLAHCCARRTTGMGYSSWGCSWGWGGVGVGGWQLIPPCMLVDTPWRKFLLTLGRASCSWSVLQ